VRTWPTNEDVRGYHEQSIQTFVDSIMARGGLAKLEKSDLDDLEAAVTDAYYSIKP
jgi:hypothetical protein